MSRFLNNVNYPYIKIWFGDFSLTKSFDRKDGRPDLFTSLSHKRYVDKANTCEINVSYVPEGNPNLLEEAIVRNRGKCKYQYGFVGSKSKTYEGLVYDYSVRFSEGYLEYNLKLISQSVITNSDTVVSYSFGKDDDSYRQGPIFLINLIDWINKKGYFKSQYGDLYKFSYNLCDRDFHLPVEGIEGNNLTPFAALREMASKFISNNGNDVKYRLVVDDSIDGESAGLVYFKKEGKDVAEFSFDWNSKNSDVISWSPNFQGAAAIFFARGEASNENGPIKVTTAISSSDEGLGYFEKINTSGINKENELRFFSDSRTVVGNTTQDLISFYDSAKYNYTASMTVLGRPEIKLVETYVKVKPHINGLLHHSAGKYMVVGINDQINSSGFMTTLDLVKIDNLPEIYKIGSSLQSIISTSDNKSSIVTKPKVRKRVSLDSESTYA